MAKIVPLLLFMIPKALQIGSNSFRKICWNCRATPTIKVLHVVLSPRLCWPWLKPNDLKLGLKCLLLYLYTQNLISHMTSMHFVDREILETLLLSSILMQSYESLRVTLTVPTVDHFCFNAGHCELVRSCPANKIVGATPKFHLHHPACLPLMRWYSIYIYLYSDIPIIVIHTTLLNCSNEVNCTVHLLTTLLWECCVTSTIVMC